MAVQQGFLKLSGGVDQFPPESIFRRTNSTPHRRLTASDCQHGEIGFSVGEKDPKEWGVCSDSGTVPRGHHCPVPAMHRCSDSFWCPGPVWGHAMGAGDQVNVHTAATHIHSLSHPLLVRGGPTDTLTQRGAWPPSATLSVTSIGLQPAFTPTYPDSHS